MNKNWSLLLVFIFMAATIAGERLSARFVSQMKAEETTMNQRLEKLASRTSQAPKEKAEYEEIKQLSNSIISRLQWTSDSTELLTWFSATADDLGVRLKQGRVLPTEQKKSLIGDGSLQRIRIEARLEGTFWGLVEYMDRIERSPKAMIVENVSLAADPRIAGAGSLELTVACVSPVTVDKTETKKSGEAK